MLKKKRVRHANGSVVLNKYPSGNHKWYFRYTDASGVHPAIPIGSIKDLKTISAAKKEADRLGLRQTYLAPAQLAKSGRMTFNGLIARYKQEEMPERWSTRHGYESWIDGHVAPRWGDTFVDEIAPAAVEKWLRDLPLAPKSKGHVKGMMTILLKRAIVWGYYTGGNFMQAISIRGGTKRLRRPGILSPEQLLALIGHIEDGYVRMVVVVSMCLGLRFSETLALQWLDVGWKEMTIWVRRGIVNGRIGPLKTEYSEAPGPLDVDLRDLLLDWREESDFTDEADWLFSSPFKAGRIPYFPTGIRRKIHAAAKAAGITELLTGEPTKILRHSYRAWLGTTGAPLAVIKDLMRHSDIRTTLNEYGNGMQPAMREANSEVVRRVFSAGNLRVN